LLRRIDKIRKLKLNQNLLDSEMAEEVDQYEDKGGYPNLLHLMFADR